MAGIEEEIVAVRAEILKEKEGKEGGEARGGDERVRRARESYGRRQSL